MTILDQLINLMLEKAEITPVDKQELDSFLLQNNIDICDEHYQFLLHYGNSNFLKSDFGDLRFVEFKDYYLDNNLLDDIKLPNKYNYIGRDFYENSLCKTPSNNHIYSFSYGKLDLPFDYNGLKELLFCNLFSHADYSKHFSKYEINIRIDNINKFKEKYSNYELKYIDIHKRYFFKDKELIICDDKFYSYNSYHGGILDKIINT